MKLITYILTLLVAASSFCEAGPSPDRKPPVSQASSTAHVLEEPPEAFVLEEIRDEVEGASETIVYDADSGAASHIKVSRSNPAILFDFGAAVKASIATREQCKQQRLDKERELQESLHTYEAGAVLDKTTPADGHCLFHALKKGGLLQQEAIGFDLTVKELRSMALQTATEEELQAAAISTGLSVIQYKTNMVKSLWGDELMLVGLTRVFHQDITVIGRNSARTFLASGGDIEGTIENAIWIAHMAEFHDYGIHRAGSLDQLGRTGGFSGSCPLCTAQFTCLSCER